MKEELKTDKAAIRLQLQPNWETVFFRQVGPFLGPRALPPGRTTHSKWDPGFPATPQNAFALLRPASDRLA